MTGFWTNVRRAANPVLAAWEDALAQSQAEVESLRQQLAAARAERDRVQAAWETAKHGRNSLADEVVSLINERDHLRAQVEELRQRASNYEIAEGTAVAQRNAALNEGLGYKRQAEAMRVVVEGWQEYWLHDRECEECHRARRLGQACWEQVQRFERVWTAGKAALDAATAGQPATPSNRPHPAPPANDSPTQAQPEVRNAGASESRPERHPEAPGA